MTDDLKNNVLLSAPAGIMSGSREVIFLVQLRQKCREEQCDCSGGIDDNLAIFPGSDERTIK